MTVETPIRDYSQAGEQAAILEWAAMQPQPGSFVDLGAFDGERYSNTAALADQGWTGICVEAAPDAAAACATRYATCPDVAVILAVFAADGSAVATIHWAEGTMYSSLEGSKRQDVSLVPIEIPSLDLAWFAARIAELPPPLFFSIDLEGASLDALEWALAYADPACVCVEANNDRDRESARDLLGDAWREMPLPNMVNLLFVRQVADR